MYLSSPNKLAIRLDMSVKHLLIEPKFPYLNSAILCLGAAHLNANTDLDFEATVRKYRFSAIQGINSLGNLTYSQDPSVSDRATAVLATCYALTFISLYMGDPFSNFLVLIRGCSSLSRRILQAGLSSPLFPRADYIVLDDPHTTIIREYLHLAQPLSSTAGSEARESLSRVEQLCYLRPFEKNMLQLMKSVVAITNGAIECKCL